MTEFANAPGSMDRRSLLKKGAVAGALAWTAPVILSQPAFAQTASGVSTVTPTEVTLSGATLSVQFAWPDLKYLVCRRGAIFSIVSGATSINQDGLVTIAGTSPGGTYPFTIRVRVEDGPCGMNLDDSAAPPCVLLSFLAERPATGSPTAVQTGYATCPPFTGP